MLIGYARVSTDDQNLDLQRDALRLAGCEKIYEDRMSGAKAARPGLTMALEVARTGDVLTVWRLDRLGRSLHDLIVHRKETGYFTGDVEQYCSRIMESVAGSDAAAPMPMMMRPMTSSDGLTEIAQTIDPPQKIPTPININRLRPKLSPSAPNINIRLAKASA